MSAVDWAMSFLFPPTCAGCARRCHEPGFCASCIAAFQPPPKGACTRCGRPFGSGDDHLCAACIATPPSFGRVWAAASYARGERDAPLTRAVRRLKYDRDVSYAKPLAGLLTGLPPAAREYDAIVPVPLHPSRLRWRGFNQAALLAKPLARLRHRPLEPLALQRLRPTLPQVGLGESERKRNIAGAFAVRRARVIAGRRLLLIDDIFTTGSTAEECARVLLAGGAQAVDVAVVARAR